MRAVELAEEIVVIKKPAKKVWKRKTQSVRAFLRTLVISLCLSFLLALSFSVILRAAVTLDSFKCEDLKKKIEEEEVVQEKLKVRLAYLSSPERIKRVAIKELGMVQPEQVTYLVLSSDELAIDYKRQKSKSQSSVKDSQESLLDKLMEDFVYTKELLTVLSSKLTFK
jgi:cell division protein FtsL